MTATRSFVIAALTAVALAPAAVAQAPSGDVPIDISAHDPRLGVTVRRDGSQLRLTWPMAENEFGALTLRFRGTEPLIEELGTATTAAGPTVPILRGLTPVTFLTVGTRDLSAQGWNVFFDNPPRRPHQTCLAALDPKSVTVRTRGARTAVVIDGLTAGPFRGHLQFTVYPGCRLVHAEAVLRTDRDACAILYDAGLTRPTPDWTSVYWVDTDDRPRRVKGAESSPAAPVASRHRAIVAEAAGGSVAVFPPPHQFLYPLDFADNFKLVWHGPGYRQQHGWGFGVRQPPDGDGRFVPWVNAPPGTDQRLGVFYLLGRGDGPAALEEVRRFTHGDRFQPLPGYKTFTSHYHVEHTLAFVREQRRQNTDGVPRGLEEPPFVTTFKAHGVDIVHLAEFHVPHTPEMSARRLELLKTLHAECRRLSDDRFLLLPGEEPNVYLGGHWISLFPKPVYWELHPADGVPFERSAGGLGTVYAVRSAADVLRLMVRERGLMWTAHPRTKSSYGYPDRYRDSDFFRSDRFLGAAWKALPADDSKPRLGTRALDLLDDMANWGARKYLPGEVDVFQVKPSSELYGHMNVNYLRLDALPRFDAGWQPVLDALRGGRFFVTTGEVLIPTFAAGGRPSGATVRPGGGTTTAVTAHVTWTFPPSFAEVVWGDGTAVHRHRVDLSAERAFGKADVRADVALTVARWVRLEVWDVAGNGAFTQPVWFE
ncbi:MAG TPA: hypothetical protein VGF55_18445 [Gemmataceae bacterium]